MRSSIGRWSSQLQGSATEPGASCCSISAPSPGRRPSGCSIAIYEMPESPDGKQTDPSSWMTRRSTSTYSFANSSSSSRLTAGWPFSARAAPMQAGAVVTLRETTVLDLLAPLAGVFAHRSSDHQRAPTDARRTTPAPRSSRATGWRQHLLVLNGWFVLRFTWAMIEEHPERVIAMVREAIEILTARQS